MEKMMYNVTVKKNVELDQEQASDLVGSLLKEDFEFITQEVRFLQRKPDLKPYEAQDLQRSIEVRAAMKVLLTYYLTYKEYTEFFEIQRMYGNVE